MLVLMKKYDSIPVNEYDYHKMHRIHKLLKVFIKSVSHIYNWVRLFIEGSNKKLSTRGQLAHCYNFKTGIKYTCSISYTQALILLV